jgi:hypothetical protein
MTTSGTYAWSPSLGQLVLYAFNRCDVRPTAIVQEHMQDANMAANMVLADWSNRGVNLWKVELFTTTLVQGQIAYDVDPSVVVMLDAYISSTSTTASTTQDRIILPVSRSEYAAFPNKGQEGLVTTFWMDRLLAPTVSLYYAPDGTQAYLKYYAIRQVQDANFTSGQTVDIPHLWMKAFAYALACELAVTWAPAKLAILQPIAKEAYDIAAGQNVETAAYYVSPMIGGYFR